MATRHRYPKYVMAEISASTIRKMVEGDYGFLPHGGIRGKRTIDGGFVARVQKDIVQHYGNKVGRRTLTKWKKEALQIISTLAVPSMRVEATVTSKLRALNSTKIFVGLTSDQRGTVRGMRAYNRHAALQPDQVKTVKDMYSTYCRK